jgi:penicillin amidase
MRPASVPGADGSLLRYGAHSVTVNRFLKYINLTISLALGVALVCLWWFVWRALPQTSGEALAPVRAPVRIYRDQRGVPLIRGESLEDVLFAQGFVTAQDRFFQMEMIRRQVNGELAAVFGPRAVQSDVEARRLGLDKVALRYVRSLRDADRAALAAYTRGVNHYLQTYRDLLPAEFRVLRYDPEPWTIADCIIAGLNMFARLTTSWKTELLKEEMLAAGDPAKVEFLFPGRGGGDTQPGSNAWAIRGEFTASGKPILANDPHLPPTLPGIWYQVHLRAPGLNAAGVSLPGLPGIIIGRNERIAWGVTNLQFDVQDLYRMDEESSRSELASARVERIRVRGRQPVEIPVLMTRRGPVAHQKERVLYALRWTAVELQRYEYPILDLNRARNWEEFREALARFPGPAQNFVYADVDGNIGYQAAGFLPLRRGCAGDIPAGEDCEWAGKIPFDALPRVFNPPSGRVVTANQDPFPGDFELPVRGQFAPPYRYRQITALLSRKAKWRAVDMLEIQKDVYSPFLHWLARECVKVLERSEHAFPEAPELRQLLAGWKGQMEIGLAAPLAAELTFQQLRMKIAERASPEKAVEYQLEIVPAVVERLFRERPEGWFEDYDAVLLEALRGAVEEGRRLQPVAPRRWDYGQANLWRLPHPLFGDLWFAGRYLRIGPVRMSGAATTVKQVTARVGPSMRMVVDLGNEGESLLNVSTGQSGHFLSAHYRDQWDAHYTGESFPFDFERGETGKLLVLRPR